MSKNNFNLLAKVREQTLRFKRGQIDLNKGHLNYMDDKITYVNAIILFLVCAITLLSVQHINNTRFNISFFNYSIKAPSHFYFTYDHNDEEVAIQPIFREYTVNVKLRPKDNDGVSSLTLNYIDNLGEHHEILIEDSFTGSGTGKQYDIYIDEVDLEDGVYTIRVVEQE